MEECLPAVVLEKVGRSGGIKEWRSEGVEELRSGGIKEWRN